MNALFFAIPIFQLYRGGQFYPWRKPEYPYCTIASLSDKLYHIIQDPTKVPSGFTCPAKSCLSNLIWQDNKNELTSERNL
jgi:hypothetical protein